jgi:hypothetical protein
MARGVAKQYDSTLSPAPQWRQIVDVVLQNGVRAIDQRFDRGMPAAEQTRKVGFPLGLRHEATFGRIAGAEPIHTPAAERRETKASSGAPRLAQQCGRRGIFERYDRAPSGVTGVAGSR